MKWANGIEYSGNFNNNYLNGEEYYLIIMEKNIKEISKKMLFMEKVNILI